MSKERLPEAFRHDLETFLAGPGWEGDLDVDRIFARTDLDAIMADAGHVDGAYDIHPGAPTTPSTAVPGCMFVEVEAGILLTDPEGRVIGCYLSAALAVDEEWQGLGLGSELVTERVLRSGENPVWNLDGPQYSPGGLAAHRSAWNAARQDPEAVMARMERIAEAERDVNTVN